VVCGPPIFHDTDNLENPIVLVEVLSKSTERHDRTTKFFEYQSIPSLKEYLLISQEPRSITHCTRLQGKEWRIETVAAEHGVVRLSTIDVELSFDRIYEGSDSLP
jgi:Uma2 family endonuclease